MRECTRTAAGFLALIGVLSFGCKREEQPKASTPPEVLVAPASIRDVPVYREWIGTLEGAENAEIRARVTGYLLKRDYKEGSLVKKGDVLFEIDPRPFEAALEEAKSQLSQTMAIQRASQAEYERSQYLFKRKVISEKEYINKMQLNVSNLAKIGALKASVEQARLNLGFCTIAAPVDGIVGISKAQVGDLVGAANGTPLTSISTVNPIKIVFPVSEGEYLAASRRVQEALATPFNERPESIELILADGKSFPHRGKLLSVDRQVKASTGTIQVTALLPNPGDVLRPGFFARAKILARVLENAVVVPQRAVSEIQGSYQVAVVGKNGKAEVRPVQVGPRVGTDWVISKGLKAGSSVVVEGIQKVKTGAFVSTKPWLPPIAEKKDEPVEGN